MSVQLKDRKGRLQGGMILDFSKDLTQLSLVGADKVGWNRPSATPQGLLDPNSQKQMADAEAVISNLFDLLDMSANPHISLRCTCLSRSSEQPTCSLVIQQDLFRAWPSYLAVARGVVTIKISKQALA